MDTKQITAKRLKKLRFEKGYSQEQLAEKAGITQKSVSLYERAVNNMSINTAKKIANLLDVSYLKRHGIKETESLKGSVFLLPQTLTLQHPTQITHSNV